MASFHVHGDQENQLANIARLKSNLVGKNARIGLQQKRTVLGDINSNSSRVVTRASSKGLKAVEKTLKNKNDFIIHEDVQEEIQVKDVGRPKNNKELPKTKKEVQSKESIEDKLVLSDTVIPIPRQPLKDLKMCATLNDEEPMSESNISMEEISPMSVESVKVTSPLVRHSKPSLQFLYDMEEYRQEIFQYLLKAETRQKAKPLYMRRQPEVTYSMRSILVDWLVEVADEYKLQTETLYLAVSFIDRFLSVMSVVKGKLQLLGTTAMFVAAKYEEIYPPDVGEFVFITDETYNKRQVLRMEQLILKVLGFDVSVPTIYAFLQHIAVECVLSVRLTNLAQYLCELTLLEGDPYLTYVPSMIACSAIVVARHCLEYDDVWSSQLQQATGYTLPQLAPCIAHLNITHSKAEKLPQQAICVKYKSQKWLKVGEVRPKTLVLFNKK